MSRSMLLLMAMSEFYTDPAAEVCVDTHSLLPLKAIWMPVICVALCDYDDGHEPCCHQRSYGSEYCHLGLF